MSDADAVAELPGGGCALSPAALTTVKLLTVRVEKGGKDKLQALLLIDEQAARPRSATSLIRILTRFPADRVDDALADAQAAFLALSSDALLSDAQSRGYASWTEAAGRGLARLSAWRGSHS